MATDSWDDIARDRAGTVLRQAFVAAQLGMPAEDHETAVESMWIILEALLVDHLAPDAPTIAERADRRASMGEHWRRLVTTAVTHTFVLGGDFVQPEPLAAAVDACAADLDAGRLWHSRRPPGPGALVLAAHDALRQLDATARSGAHAGPDDMRALVALISSATVGAVLADRREIERSASAEFDEEPGSTGRWARSPESVAAAFGIPDSGLVAVSRHGWACDSCGCLFLGRVEAGTAYPDRFAPIGRVGACDVSNDCSCHRAPLQRDVR